ncbi:hypothetical protein ACFQXB_17290 [Plastorhodobacter daqingensis]|uniref:DUF2388 domain-containing protein n=1 Tax=Plastorhodobacter daqingensis TaxID=1387281 RepID=A0ABW2UQY7_9RHOB
MQKKLVLAALAACVSAGAASAGPIGAGKAQLAAQLGVDAAAYSVADLIALDVARRDNDQLAERFILNGTGKAAAKRSAATVGRNQLAASLGVSAADYTLPELVSMLPAGDD